MTRWMSLQLPFLPIERLTLAMPGLDRAPFALLSREGERDVVVASSAAARKCGVKPGLPAAAARALCAGLEIRRHEPDEDRRLLERLAVIAQQFTPDVCLDGASGLFLEVGRTARRFGGEGSLAERVRALCTGLGHHPRLGIASTSRAARALARAGGAAIAIAPGDDPRPALVGLPWRVLSPPDTVADAFIALGLETVGDVLRLPWSGIAARCGDDFLRELQCLVGERDEPLVRVRPVDLFAERFEFWQPTDDSSRIIFVAKRLFDLAEAHLAVRNQGLATIELDLIQSDDGSVLHLALRPGVPTRDARVLVRLLGHRLEREALRSPVEEIRLWFDETVPLPERQGLLFDEAPAFREDDEALALKDRLAVRLGEDRVNAPLLLDDHRPERAFRWRKHGEAVDLRSPAAVACAPPGRRPLELHASPQRVMVGSDASGRPLAILEGSQRGPLRVVRGPERIESGWWDGQDVRRLYFEVETPLGIRLWVFRDQHTGTWHQHGTFQ